MVSRPAGISGEIIVARAAPPRGLRPSWLQASRPRPQGPGVGPGGEGRSGGHRHSLDSLNYSWSAVKLTSTLMNRLLLEGLVEHDRARQHAYQDGLEQRPPLWSTLTARLNADEARTPWRCPRKGGILTAITGRI
jgi:hypothetical protein